MRARRANYMILFAMLLPVMLGFMALAIDLGRLRVARVQVQGAADAAAIAALAQLRDTGSYSLALGAANNVANAVRIQRLGPSPGTEFDVDLATGAWNFTNRQWAAGNGAISAVTVNLEQRAPLGLLFAPVFEMGAGSGFGGRVYGGGEVSPGGENGANKRIRLGRRAAMRPRDIVVAVDISQPMWPHLDDVRGALTGFVDQVRVFGISEDRIGVVAFAGAAIEYSALQLAEEEAPTIRTAMQDLAPCEVDLASWFHWYRFMDSALDPELEDMEAFDYSPIWFTEVWDDGQPRMRWPVESYEAQLTLDVDHGVLLTEETWLDPLPDEAQCLAWGISQILFQYADPRRTEPGTFAPYDFAPLACHVGNYWEGDPNRFIWGTSYVEVDCSITGWEEAFPGHPAVMDGGDPDDDFDFPDRSYSQAGTNPGSGLQLAAEMLQAVMPSRNEPTVVLVTGAGARCGPSIDPGEAPDCTDPFEQEMAAALDLLEEMGVHTHILAVVPSGSDDEAWLADRTTGRGIFTSTTDPNDLDDLLADIARDIRLQVVE